MPEGVFTLVVYTDVWFVRLPIAPSGRPKTTGNVSLKEAEKIPPVNKVEKPLPVDENNKLTGLTVREIKPRWKVGVVAANVVTGEGSDDQLVAREEFLSAGR